MNIFGIGFQEILLIFVIALIVLGPKNLVKTSRDISTAIRKFAASDTWRSIVSSTHEIRNIQEKIIDETGLQESINTLRNSTNDMVSPNTPNRWNSLRTASLAKPEQSDVAEISPHKSDDQIQPESNRE
jgi:sec-independent protein translocase protein TatB